jgi:outer membrane protein OmpA-like peptidoglycan-associated protein
VEAIGEGGATLGTGDVAGGAQPAVTVEWTGKEEPLKLAITGWDEHDLPASLELSPWSYDIPHEDVVFASDQSVIADTEVPKLETAWTELQRVLARYGSIVQVKLFVAGYTDTVGDGAHNQALSDARAKSIAGWFRTRGFKGQISYQGFGETALAVATPDQTDELRNRRAKYVLAAEEPARSGDIPRSAWKPLP